MNYTNPASTYSRQQGALTTEAQRTKLQRVRNAMEVASLRRKMAAKNINSSKYGKV